LLPLIKSLNSVSASIPLFARFFSTSCSIHESLFTINHCHHRTSADVLPLLNLTLYYRYIVNKAFRKTIKLFIPFICFIN
jgi:hypothetical protein